MHILIYLVVFVAGAVADHLLFKKAEAEAATAEKTVETKAKTVAADAAAKLL